jgi:hypothetical protein
MEIIRVKKWNGISGLNGRAQAFDAKVSGFNPRLCLIFEALFPFHGYSYESVRVLGVVSRSLTNKVPPFLVY